MAAAAPPPDLFAWELGASLIAASLTPVELAAAVAAATGARVRDFRRRLDAWKTIRRLWSLVRTAAWLNSVIRDCTKHHPYPTRLETNIADLYPFLDRDLRGLDALLTTRRFIRGLVAPPLCPLCLVSPIGAAAFIIVDDDPRISGMDPLLYFGCLECLKSHLIRNILPWKFSAFQDASVRVLGPLRGQGLWVEADYFCDFWQRVVVRRLLERLGSGRTSVRGLGRWSAQASAPRPSHAG